MCMCASIWHSVSAYTCSKPPPPHDSGGWQGFLCISLAPLRRGAQTPSGSRAGCAPHHVGPELPPVGAFAQGQAPGGQSSAVMCRRSLCLSRSHSHKEVDGVPGRVW